MKALEKIAARAPNEMLEGTLAFRAHRGHLHGRIVLYKLA